MEATFYAGTLFVLATTTVLAYVGLLQQRRASGTEGDRAAIYAFAMWWYAAAAVLFLLALQALLVLVGVETVLLHNVIRYIRMGPLSIAAGSLLFFMLYLLTGRMVWRRWLVAAYSAFLAFTIYYAYLAEPVTVEVTAWAVRTVGTPVPSWMVIVFGVLLAGPILLATFAYATLFFKVQDARQRYRLALLAISFIVWFGAILVGFLAGLTSRDWFPILYEAPGLLAGLLVILAYQPPQWIQRRLAATSAESDAQTA
ncbi:MAG TPA: hypothetical protein VGB18_03590 [Candidatus Thermoplasmatota archaeon]